MEILVDFLCLMVMVLAFFMLMGIISDIIMKRKRFNMVKMHVLTLWKDLCYLWQNQKRCYMYNRYYDEYPGGYDMDNPKF